MSKAEEEDRIVIVNSCRAFQELKDQSPLTESEWQRFRGQIVECGLKGLPFDEVSYIYPLQIPMKPRIQVLQESPRVISVLGIYDRSCCVGIIGDIKLESHYLAHKGAFLYVVGKLEKCKKNDKEYLNLRPRGWLIVQVGSPEQEQIANQIEKEITRRRK